MSYQFKDKLAIVTGASKLNGIGFATAYALVEGGADLVITYNTNKTAAQEVIEKIHRLGAKAIAVHANAGSITFGEDLVDATVKAFPGRKIDIIVNNAGHLTMQEGAEAAVVDEFDSIFHRNVRGPHLLIKAALPYLSAPGARIVNVGSVVARTGTKHATFYSSSKGALNLLNLAWAEELGPRGITVNVVAPGPIDTDYGPPDDMPLTIKFRAQQYLKRNGSANEAANAILFAVSPGASFITGQVLAVDGGLAYT